MKDMIRLLRDALPEIIGGLVVATVLAIVGLLYAELGPWTVAFAIAGTIAVASIALFLLIRRRKAKPSVQKSVTRKGGKGTLANLVVETLEDGQVVRGIDLPLTIEGQYSIEGRYSSVDLGVWVVLQDAYGHFYLQNPSITFLPDGRWTATNVLPGMGIEIVHFVQVDKRGQAHFQQMVAGREWGAFGELPPGSTILRSIRISRVK